MTKKAFIQHADADIIEELWDSYIFPETMPFREFLRHYQVKHRAKYGKRLNVVKKRLFSFSENTYAPLSLIPFGAIYFLILHFIINL